MRNTTVEACRVRNQNQPTNRDEGHPGLTVVPRAAPRRDRDPEPGTACALVDLGERLGLGQVDSSAPARRPGRSRIGQCGCARSLFFALGGRPGGIRQCRPEPHVSALFFPSDDRARPRAQPTAENGRPLNPGVASECGSSTNRIVAPPAGRFPAVGVAFPAGGDCERQSGACGIGRCRMPKAMLSRSALRWPTDCANEIPEIPGQRGIASTAGEHTHRDFRRRHLARRVVGDNVVAISVPSAHRSLPGEGNSASSQHCAPRPTRRSGAVDKGREVVVKIR